MTTTTILDNGGVSRCCNRTDANYATNHAAANSDLVGTTAISIGQRTTGNYDIFRGEFVFDTSTIPVGAVISAVSNRLYGIGSGLDTNYTMKIVRNAGQVFPHNPVVVADYNHAAYDQEVDTTWSTTSYAAGYNTIAWPAGAFAYIVCGGSTKFSLRSKREYDSNVPTGAEYCNFESGLHAGNHYPELIVTYDTSSYKPNSSFDVRAGRWY